MLDGAGPIDYVDEGLHIMRDIKALLLRMKAKSTRDRVASPQRDNVSMTSYQADSQMFPKIHQTPKARMKGPPIGTISLMSESQHNGGMMESSSIKRLELEYLRLNKRFMQIQDASYIVGLQNRLTIAEAESRDKKAAIRRLENQQRLLDRQIQRQARV